MHEFRHLLAVLNTASTHQVALQRAARLARKNNGKVTALLPAGDTAAGVREAIEAQLEQLKSDGLEATLEVSSEKDVLRAVLLTQHQHAFDLAVKEPQPHTLADEVFTSLDWKLLRSTRSPVLLVRSDAHGANAPVLAAVEAHPSDEEHRELNQDILDDAQWLAARLEAPLHLFSAHPAPMQDPMHPDQDLNALAREFRAACLELGAGHGIPESQVHVASGPAELLIPQSADSLDAQLVVLGTVARTGLRGVLLGNTAEQVLEKVHTDVLVIPPRRSA
ncbi:hypothetical protein GCM10011348_11940 [Marinobacterium nitratireducens]|uniref:UspA domain-containing protein n=1 Tax=Marinobacterium nitratireducens TaxID=518897 RepID=A0A917Z9U7_9GAMM|nr:universal stress protein [Marinobacterium nitratireducens]GGO78921.1 hypothetical protein GCM10011348_11940 [Marinobacterium nitratireducens]